MSRSVEDGWVLDEAEDLLDMDGGGNAWSWSLPACRAARSSLSTTRPRATGSGSASETAAPRDVGCQPRGLMRESRALDALEQLADAATATGPRTLLARSGPARPPHRSAAAMI